VVLAGSRCGIALASLLLLVALGGCNDSGSNENPYYNPCSAGFELCNGYCVPAGTCATFCGVGYVYCNGECLPGDTCAAGCSDGYEDCGDGACVPLGSCNLGVGGTPGGGGTAGTGGNVILPGTGGRENVIIPASCNDTGSKSGAINDAFGRTDIQAGAKTYVLQANWWDTYSGQTIGYNGLGFTINGSTPDNGNVPAGFPSLYLGSYAGSGNAQAANLPRQVSSLTAVPTEFWTNLTSLNHAGFNAAYDVWLTASGNVLGSGQYDPGGGGAYLMVWLNNPANHSPLGGVSGGVREVFGVEGNWTVFRSSSAGPGGLPIVSYVAAEPIAGLAFDLKAFIDDAVDIGILSPSMYLSVIFAGFEVWSGAGGAQVTKFCADVR
jgi:hypothetical protein